MPFYRTITKCYMQHSVTLYIYQPESSYWYSTSEQCPILDYKLGSTCVPVPVAVGVYPGLFDTFIAIGFS